MATFLKDVLYPGSYSVPDGKGGRRKVEFSRADVRKLGRRLQEMIAAGLQIPFAAEHQTQAKPLTDAERKAEWVKKLTLGWISAGEMAPEGFLTSQVEVPLAEDAKRLPAVRFVSPEIVNDFVDGSGRFWPGPSISHVALTPRPVQHHQKPFQPVHPSRLRLSLNDYEGESMPLPPDPANAPAADAKGFDLDKLRALLADDGYGVPDHIDDHSEFLEHLNTAALSKKAMVDKLLSDKEGDDDPPDDPTEPGDDPNDVTVPANAPLMMSLAGHRLQIQRGAKPATQKGTPQKPPIRTPVAGDERSKRLEKALLTERRQSIASRIERLYESGRITKPIRDKLQSDTGTVRLSLDEAGNLSSNVVLAKVEAYEELSPGAAWAGDDNLPPLVAAAEPSGRWHPDDSPKEVAQRVDDFFATLNRNRK